MTLNTIIIRCSSRCDLKKTILIFQNSHRLYGQGNTECKANNYSDPMYRSNEIVFGLTPSQNQTDIRKNRIAPLRLPQYMITNVT